MHYAHLLQIDLDGCRGLLLLLHMYDCMCVLLLSAFVSQLAIWWCRAACIDMLKTFHVLFYHFGKVILIAVSFAVEVKMMKND